MFDVSFFGISPWLVIVLAAALAVFWIYEFVQLMSTPQEVFVGAYDRYAWVAVFVLVWAVAPFAFFAWTSMRDTPRGARQRHVP